MLEADGVDAPEGVAAVLAAALDGLLLHRALQPERAAPGVAPILRRLLEHTPDKEGDRT